jgi:hypothetical protein
MLLRLLYIPCRARISDNPRIRTYHPNGFPLRPAQDSVFDLDCDCRETCSGSPASLPFIDPLAVQVQKSDRTTPAALVREPRW